MNRKTIAFLISFIIPSILLSQNYDFGKQIEQARRSLNEAFYNTEQQDFLSSNIPNQNLHSQSSITQHLKMLDKIKEISSERFYNDVRENGDTLIVGDVPGEELVVSGNWTAPGPIIVMNDGLIWFHKAHATLMGDVFVIGNGRIIADSSTLFMPQEFFYQRQILVIENAEIQVRNSTMDFGGLTNNMAVAQNARLFIENVVKPDFSTISLLQSAVINIDGIDLAGEFICDHSSMLRIKNAETVLVWHRFQEGSSALLEFPDGSNISSYVFNNQTPDVSGIDYSVELENCKDVWWGLMPSNGSDITISNSEIRVIGLWFEDNEQAKVSGLVNNTDYTDQLINLDDRNLRLVNTHIDTWSLYTFDETEVELESCIIGEIGVMGRSTVEGMFYYCDGSGGYIFTTDTCFHLSGFSSLSSSFRTSGHGIGIFAYSTMTNGLPTARNNSILMLIQSSFPEAPYLEPGACIWNASIQEPSSMPVNTVNEIIGSAWIDKGPLSSLMDFDKYEIFYQSTEDTTNWFPIGAESYDKVYNDVLVNWNTNGLSPGSYTLKLEISDDDGNQMEALKTVTLLPAIYGVDDHVKELFTVEIFPNPTASDFNIILDLKKDNQLKISMFNILGEEVLRFVDGFKSSGTYRYTVNTDYLESGLYFCKIGSGENRIIKKVIVQ